MHHIVRKRYYLHSLHARTVHFRIFQYIFTFFFQLVSFIKYITIRKVTNNDGNLHLTYIAFTNNVLSQIMTRNQLQTQSQSLKHLLLKHMAIIMIQFALVLLLLMIILIAVMLIIIVIMIIKLVSITIVKMMILIIMMISK